MMTRVLRLVVCVSMCGAGTMASCAGKQGGFAREYELGRYESALATAQREATVRSGPRREHAALVAGLSAHALARDEVAESWLRPLTHSKDREIAGRATAALGLIARRRGAHPEAAELLGRAADMLEGVDGRRAGQLAGDSLLASRRGETGTRDTYPVVAASNTSGSALAARLTGGAYCVQVGAFSTVANAEIAAERTRWQAERLGLGEPRVVAGSDAQGRRLYLVQVGRFAARDEAESARRRLGGEGLVAYAAE